LFEYTETVDIQMSSSNILNFLVNDILDFAQVKDGKFRKNLEIFDLKESVEEIIDISSECRTCCKSYKVNPILRPGQSLRGKYKYALLTYNENSLEQYSEIQDFILRDVNDIVSFKGESRFKAVHTSSGHRADMDINMMMMYGGGGLFGGGGGPPKLMLFGKQKQGGWSPEDEDEAGEVINLRGWKREDVKDMLMTLLPNA
jgi:hypothetical protein